MTDAGRKYHEFKWDGTLLCAECGEPKNVHSTADTDTMERLEHALGYGNWLLLRDTLLMIAKQIETLREQDATARKKNLELQRERDERLTVEQLNAVIWDYTERLVTWMQGATGQGKSWWPSNDVTEHIRKRTLADHGIGPEGDDRQHGVDLEWPDNRSPETEFERPAEPEGKSDE